MVTSHQYAAAFRRNAAIAAATGIAVGFLFLYPTSTNGTASRGSTRGGDPVAGAGELHAVDDGHGHTSMDVTRGADIVDGPAVESVYGPVQVRIYVTEKRLVWVEALDYPRNSAVDKVLNDEAIPLLNAFTLMEGDADIDTVSGATHTSEAYRDSLQAALDAANL